MNSIYIIFLISLRSKLMVLTLMLYQRYIQYYINSDTTIFYTLYTRGNGAYKVCFIYFTFGFKYMDDILKLYIKTLINLLNKKSF